MNKTGFPKTKRPGFSTLYVVFVICLWTCPLTWVETTYKSTCEIFLAQSGPRKKLQKAWRNFTSFGR